MLSQLKAAHKVVGVKQSKKVIVSGEATLVFIAKDAEMRIVRPIIELCREQGIEMSEAYSMQELGEAAGIDVGAAVVTQLGA